jgi:ribosomal protein L18E
MLREENEALKQRLKILEESGGQAEDVTEQVQKRLQEPCSSKEGLHLCKLKSVYQNDDLHHLYLHPHYWFFINFPIAVYVKCKKQ